MKHYPVPTWIMIAVVFSLLMSCGSGNGKVTATAPYIYGELISIASGSVPPNFRNALVYIADSSTGDPVSNAVVTMNGVSLLYDITGQVYESDVVISPGEYVTLTVSVDGYTYAATGSQFISYPSVSSPLPGSTWPMSCDNKVTWSGGDLTADADYRMGVLDAATGEMIWPAGAAVSTDKTSYIIPANSLTFGDLLVIAGISRNVFIPDAAPGSNLIISGFTFVPIKTSALRTLVSINVTPPSLTAAKGSTQQLAATGSYCIDGYTTTQNITSLVTWSSSSMEIAAVSNTTGSNGEVAIVSGGTATITASSGTLSGSASLVTTNWTLRPSGTITNLDEVVWSGTQFVAVGWGGTILTSPDGVIWTKQLSPDSYSDLHSVVWSGSQFVAVGRVILTSPDGVIWTIRNSGMTYSLNNVAWSGSQFVAVGYPGVIITSPDGITWTQRTSGTGNPLNCVTWAGTQYVVGGYPGVILTSPDGVAWTSQNSGTSFRLDGIVWSGTQTVVVGGEIITSPDGVIWTLHDRNTTYDWTSVAWSGEQFLAVGFYGTIISSPEGATWTSQPSGIDKILSSVAWSGSRYVVVGWGGTILTSP